MINNLVMAIENWPKNDCLQKAVRHLKDGLNLITARGSDIDSNAFFFFFKDY